MKMTVTALGFAALMGLTGVGQAAETGAQAAGAAMSQQGAASAQQQAERGNRMVVGRVVEVRTVQVKGIDEKHNLVKIERSGKRIIVDLGTEDEQGWIADLEPGDLLFASGRSARINGRPVLMAKWAAEVKPVGHGVSRQAP